MAIVCMAVIHSWVTSPSEAEAMADKGFVEITWRDSCGSMRHTYVDKDSEAYRKYLHESVLESGVAKP